MIRLMFGALLITIAVAAGISLAPIILEVIGYGLLFMLIFPLKWLGVL